MEYATRQNDIEKEEERMAEAAEIESGGFVKTLKDLFAGAAGGVAQVLLGELPMTERSG